MIVLTTEHRSGAEVVRLRGAFGVDDDPVAVAARLVEAAGDDQLLVDLGDVEGVEGPAVAELLRDLERGPHRAATVIVHHDLEARRRLRSYGLSLPVVPDLAAMLRCHIPAPSR